MTEYCSLPAWLFLANSPTPCLSYRVSLTPLCLWAGVPPMPSLSLSQRSSHPHSISQLQFLTPHSVFQLEFLPPSLSISQLEFFATLLYLSTRVLLSPSLSLSQRSSQPHSISQLEFLPPHCLSARVPPRPSLSPSQSAPTPSLSLNQSSTEPPSLSQLECPHPHSVFQIEYTPPLLHLSARVTRLQSMMVTSTVPPYWFDDN